MRGCLIYNPAAGSMAHDRVMEKAAESFREAGWKMDLAISRSGEHTGELVREAAGAGLRAVIVAGGDGSAGRAAGELMGTETALGVLPAGSANVWASELGTPGRWHGRTEALTRSARALARGVVQAVDIGVCGGHPFLLWAGAGLDAEIVKEMETGRHGRRKFARTKYLAAGLRKAASWKGIEASFEVDGKRVAGHFVLCVVSNIRGYAGGLSAISPQAVLDDGEMDLWLFSGDSMRRTLQHAWELFAGRHAGSSEVKYMKFRHLVMTATSDPAWQLDGEPMQIPGRTTVEVLPRAVQVIVPAKRPDGLFSTTGTAIQSMERGHDR